MTMFGTFRYLTWPGV